MDQQQAQSKPKKSDGNESATHPRLPIDIELDEEAPHGQGRVAVQSLAGWYSH